MSTTPVPPSWDCGGTSHLLPLERAKATFDVSKMSCAIYGSKENVARRRFIIGPIDNGGPDLYEESREVAQMKAIDNFISIHKDFTTKNFRPQQNDVGYMSENSTRTGPIMPGFLLFLPTVMGQASDEQIALWYPKTLRFEMVGAYCQTELSHGSNVRGIETTATFDKATGDFILHSPNLGSTKWWNSGTGCVATHGAVFAKLHLPQANGELKDYGLHCFLVQFRDENHLPLPGIELGDVGVKLGDNGLESGYIRFNQVRVPREHLMAKRQYVSREGVYVKREAGMRAGSEFAHYMTMVRARAGTVAQCSGKLSAAATIAARYSCVRLQGYDSKGKESAIIEYRIQRFRVMRAIAHSYAFRFTSTYMIEKMAQLSQRVAAGEDLTDIAEIHAASSGLKSVCTRLACDGIEDARRCCGGHGYLLNSGVARLAADFVWIGTAEGDFYVLILQTARFLVKSYQMAKKGEKLSGLMQVMAPLKDAAFDPLAPSVMPRKPQTVADAISLEYLEKMLALRVLVLVKQVGERIEEMIKKEKASFEQAFNAHALELEQAATCHILYFIFHHFKNFVEQYSEDANCKRALTFVCAFWGAAELARGGQWNGMLDRSSHRLVEEGVNHLLDQLRPDIVALVDAFDIPDSVLNSSLGRSDGNVYEALYEGAKKSSLNRQQPFHGYEQVLKPHLDQGFLKLRGRPHPQLVEAMSKAKL